MAAVYCKPWEGTWQQLCNSTNARIYNSLEDAREGMKLILRVSPSWQWSRPPSIPDNGWIRYEVGGDYVIRELRLTV